MPSSQSHLSLPKKPTASSSHEVSLRSNSSQEEDLRSRLPKLSISRSEQERMLRQEILRMKIPASQRPDHSSKLPALRLSPKEIMNERVLKSIKMTTSQIFSRMGYSKELMFGCMLDNQIWIVSADLISVGDGWSVSIPSEIDSLHKILLHNHPSNNPEPSELDLDLAISLNRLGIGLYIISQDCSLLRIVSIST